MIISCRIAVVSVEYYYLLRITCASTQSVSVSAVTDSLHKLD